MLQRRFLHRFGGRFGLLALWLQLALSFGHIHADEVFRYGHPVGHGVGAAEIATPGNDAPAMPEPVAALHLDCAICANMALASALLPALPPALPTPGIAGSATDGGDCALDLASPPHLLFQTRAPPAA